MHPNGGGEAAGIFVCLLNVYMFAVRFVTRYAKISKERISHRYLKYRISLTWGKPSSPPQKTVNMGYRLLTWGTVNMG